MWVYHDHRLRPKANRKLFPSGSVIFSAVHFAVNVFQRFINGLKTHSWSAAVHSMQNIFRDRAVVRRNRVNTITRLSILVIKSNYRRGKVDKKKNQVSEVMFKLQKEQTAQAEYWKIFISFFMSGKMKLKPSWGTDDICLAYSIYYLIIHHVFCRRKGMPIWEQVLILKSGCLPAYSSNPITSNLFTWCKTCNCLLIVTY